jgi:hypothetical protein
MIPDIHTSEKLVMQHRHQLFQEAERERMLKMVDSPKYTSRGLSRLAGKLGMVLLGLGIKLKQFEQRSEAIASPDKSR